MDLRHRLRLVLASRCILVAAHDLARWMLRRLDARAVVLTDADRAEAADPRA